MRFERTFRFLESRLALNIYFWVFLFLLKFSDAEGLPYPSALSYSLMVFLALFPAALTYTNNLVLLPRFWFNKRKLLYIGWALLLLLTVSLVYVLLLKRIPVRFPGMDPMALSMVMYPISDSFSPDALFTDVQPYFMVLTAWLLLFSFPGSFHYRHKINLQKIRRMEEAIGRHREAELAFLRSQVNPHFLFNTLNNLYALSRNNSEKASDSILKLSTVLRYVLYESNAELVSYSTEKDIMQAYIDIELLRIESSPGLNFSISADSDYQIPPLIWMPVLENLFKHTRMVDKLDCDFRFAIHKGDLSVSCRNNMVNTLKNDDQLGGIGLENLRKRLELLYPLKHSITTRREEDQFYTEVRVTLEAC